MTEAFRRCRLLSAAGANVSDANANQGRILATKRFRSTLMCNYPLQISIHESESNWVTAFSEQSGGIPLSYAHQRQHAQSGGFLKRYVLLFDLR